MKTATETYVGPATVVETGPDRLLVRGPGGTRPARTALAVPYDPVAGDVVLVIEGEETYVIGVLSGRGLTRIDAPGDLAIRAGGAVTVLGGSAVSLNAPQVALKASRLEFAAERLFARFGDVYQWVRGALRTVAGRTRTVSQGTVSVRAQRIVETAEGDVRIDGRQVLLG